MNSTDDTRVLKVVETVHHGSSITQTVWMGGYAHWLKDSRKRLGLSLRKLAKKAGVATNVIQSAEASRTLPTLANHLKIMAALDKEVMDVDFTEKS